MNAILPPAQCLTPAQARKTRLQMALRFAAKGVPVFPCEANGKRPAVKAWQVQATRDEETIRAWFSKYPNCNFGLVMGTEFIDAATGEKYYYAAIDLDMKNGCDGGASLAAACEKANIDFPAILERLLIQSTPSGGEHLIGLTRNPLKTVAGVMPGVDVRGRGGYVVGAGSQIDGKFYGLENDVPFELMGELENLFEAAGERPASKAGEVLNNIDERRARLRAFKLLTDAPEVTEGERNDKGFVFASQLKDAGLSLNEALPLMGEWNELKCVPPLDNDELTLVTRSAFKNGRYAQGSAAPEAVFSKVEITAENVGVHPLEKLNRQFALVTVGSDVRVLWETFDEKHRPDVRFLKIPAFNAMMAAHSLQTSNKTESLSAAWMQWPGRRTYSRVVFMPGREAPEGFFNLWKGFAVAPRKGDWSKMQAHLRDVICGKDEACFQYLVGWLANMVQKPGERAGVAVVFRGPKGAGKSIVGNWLCRIFGKHAAHISNSDHLVGKFNSHLADKVFLFADEAFFAGDRKNEGTLKALITEPTLTIERKGLDATQEDNCLHILMASNSDWVIPATADERRYFVLDVSDEHQGRPEYFRDLMQEVDNGGLEAMLFDLLNFDLDRFNGAVMPQTAALGDQKIESLRGAERWLHDVLSERGLAGGLSPRWGAGEFVIEKQRAYSNYLEKSRRDYREFSPVSSTSFWKSLRKIIKALQDYRGGTTRERSVIFPPLKDARLAFERHLRQAVDWGDDEGNIFD